MIDYLMLINRVHWLAERGITEKIVILGIFSTFIFVFLVIFKNINFKEMVIMKNKKNSVFYILKNSIIDILYPISGNITTVALLSNALYFLIMYIYIL